MYKGELHSKIESNYNKPFGMLLMHMDSSNSPMLFVVKVTTVQSTFLECSLFVMGLL